MDYMQYAYMFYISSLSQTHHMERSRSHGDITKVTLPFFVQNPCEGGRFEDTWDLMQNPETNSGMRWLFVPVTTL
jgi:hypothetical protein